MLLSVVTCSVSNETLVLTNGVVFAYYDGCMVWLRDGSQFISQGAPNQRNYIVYNNLALEWPESFAPRKERRDGAIFRVATRPVPARYGMTPARSVTRRA
jgi:hypothetical protein